MLKAAFMGLLVNVAVLALPSSLAAQHESRLAAIPRVDVHAHIGADVELMERYVHLSKVLKDKFNANLDIWVDLGLGGKWEKLTTAELKEVDERFKGRFLLCLNDYRIRNGLKYTPEEIAEWQQRGVVGYKIHVDLQPGIDGPAHEPTFAAMERLGFLGTAIHISQPYPTKWCRDPVKHWRAHNAWERVLDRHPNLKVVQAHMADHITSDDQLDYLKYYLETYPNVNVDTCGRLNQFYRMDQKKLRDFMIQYADRILFGTDIRFEPSEGHYIETAKRYQRCFQILETDNVVAGGFYGRKRIQGLKLPLDVLEKIYYRNAARIYPRVKDVLQSMGYSVE